MTHEVPSFFDICTPACQNFINMANEIVHYSKIWVTFMSTHMVIACHSDMGHYILFYHHHFCLEFIYI